MDDVRRMMYLKYLAMITNFDVKRVAVAIDVAIVEGVGSGELPRSCGIDALQHGIERVVLVDQRNRVGAPTLAIRTLDEVRQLVGNLAVHAYVPCFYTVVAKFRIAILIIYRRDEQRIAKSHAVMVVGTIEHMVIVVVITRHEFGNLTADGLRKVAAVPM